MNLNHLFDKRLSETELMLGETETAERKRPELTMMMKTLMEDDEWKQEFLERSEKFEKRYPKMIHFGFLGMIIIPLIFLILMSAWNQTGISGVMDRIADRACTVSDL